MAKRNKRGHTDWPTPRDPFLAEALTAIRRRRKSLRYHGVRLSFWDGDDPYEWLEVTWSGGGAHVAVQLVARNTAHVFVSNHRGKILLRLEDLRVVRNGPAILRAIETSRGATTGWNSWATVCGTVRQTWADLSLSLV